ncbi:hypothetical protein BX666DRAFT_1912637 [Dichotomocladium elegans]|nr:hypothetical protein BX666DRAFT_1912637 [Dichotomocladium elegans]
MTQDHRPLGLLERYQLSKQLIKAYGAVTLTVVFQHAPRNNSDTRDFYFSLLHQPLSRLIVKHPLLNVAVLEAGKPNARFVTVPEYDLASVVTFDELAYWDLKNQGNRIAEQCDKEFDLDDHCRPLWRLHIDTHPSRINECSITLAVQHVIADGRSLTIFWQDLLGFLSEEAKTSQGPFVLRPPRPITIAPAYENRNGPSPGILDLSKIILGQIFPFFKPTPGWQGDKPAVTDKAKACHHTVVRPARLDGDDWAAICETAKVKGVSPHAAIMTAIALAFAELYPEQDILETATPVNCRFLCKPAVPEDEIGNFVGSYNHRWTISNMTLTSGFWALAQEYADSLRTNKIKAAKEAHLLKFLKQYPDDYYKFWYDKWESFSMGRSGGIELSDLGRALTDHHPMIQMAFFSQSIQIFTSAINVNTISTKDAMQLTVAWQHESIDEARIERFIPLLLEKLKTSIMCKA